MSAKYKIGDVVYRAHCGSTQVRKPCPVCYGKLRVTVVLGNDDTVSVPCDYCGKGYEGPRGYDEEYEYTVGADLFVVSAIQTVATADGEKHEYFSTLYHSMREAELYDTRDEALVAAIAEKAKLDEEKVTRADYIKKDKLKTYSWNAGYHLRCVKQARKDLEYHERMAVLCKAKSKDKGDA